MPIRELHDRFGISFLHLWGICSFLVSLLYARFEFLLMHSNPWCMLFIQQTIIIQGWLLYTDLIQFSVRLQFSFSLWVILHDQLLIVVSKINLSHGSISTNWVICLVINLVICLVIRDWNWIWTLNCINSVYNIQPYNIIGCWINKIHQGFECMRSNLNLA